MTTTNEAETDRGSGSQTNSDIEFSKQMMRVLRSNAHHLLRIVRGVPYAELSRFAHDLGTCYRTGVDMPRAMELTVRCLKSTPVGRSLSGASDAIRSGQSIASALSPAASALPPFFLPVIGAGEKSGRLDEAFAFLEEHCKLLAGPAAAIRNLWLIPTVIMLVGSILKVCLVAALASPVEALQLLASELSSWFRWIVCIVLVLLTPLRLLLDRLRLVLPYWGTVERDLAVHRFCRVFALVYAVGEYRVEHMITMATEAVDNSDAKLDFLKAAAEIRSQSTIGESFRIVSLLTDEEKSTIEVGDMAGTLQQSLTVIADQTGARLVHRVEVIKPLLFRAVMTVTMLTITMTLLRLLG